MPKLTLKSADFKEYQIVNGLVKEKNSIVHKTLNMVI